MNLLERNWGVASYFIWLIHAFIKNPYNNLLKIVILLFHVPYNKPITGKNYVTTVPQIKVLPETIGVTYFFTNQESQPLFSIIF